MNSDKYISIKGFQIGLQILKNALQILTNNFQNICDSLKSVEWIEGANFRHMQGCT